MISQSSVTSRWSVVVLVVLLGSMVVRAANVTPNIRDTLVYKDGDRVQGVIVSQTAELIVFKSDRVGEIQVPAADAVVIKADKGAKPPAAVAEAKPPATAPAKTIAPPTAAATPPKK